MVIREIKVSDAENLVRLILQVEAESKFMLMEAGERQVTPEQQKIRIENMIKSENSTIFVAEKDNTLIGYLFAIGGTVRRTKHSAYIVIGILKDYRGKGIGTKLFTKLEEWAIGRKIHRLELTVVSGNEAGVALYKRMGFEIEGIKKHSLLIAGEYTDEYYMAKLFSNTSKINGQGEKSL
ncbi:GNAT family N-acetyltransferase [Neobacillus vireti]|uniref:N-acetyltransferase GCN5 n=1 Tax=Neobacillus vireti LMG 21834 TaxID=1131730 RepID=A0AB94IUN9_9BACI|nr:GNAT family N-acetyltransferase [Neobacillus vireti]ETI70770.1 N-acetyltransferase GCN5 [Neobacillus vireti LMG 21834]KLT17689.1 GCN5 family acetyltransferase [Neobacillus vireti]